MKKRLLGSGAHWVLGAFALGLPLAPAGYAQDAEEASSEITFEEIIVSARKTEESIQKVPISVTAFSSEDIFERGIQNIEDLSRATPGFVFDTPFGRQFDRPIIRGQANILGASGVSVFIDGVNVTQSIRALNFGDIDRIEVIKGPQSALFGRNTYSGAINITTRQPTNEFKGEASFEIGEDNLYQLLGNVRGPLIEDKLYFSLSGRFYDFESEFDRPGNDNPSLGNESSRTISAVLRATPSDKWEMTFRAAYNKDDDGHFPIGLLGFDNLNVNVPGGTDLGGVQPFFQGVVPTSAPNPSGSAQLSDTLGEGGGIEREELFLSFNSSYDFDNGYSIFGTVGYTIEDFRSELDSDGQPEAFSAARIFGPFPLGAPPAPFGVGLLPFDFTTTDDDHRETFVAEFRIDSPQEERFRWRLGAYYFDDTKEDRDLLERFADGRFEAAALADFNQALADIAANLGQPFVVSLVPFSYGPVNPQTTKTINYAAFGSVEFDFTDKLTGTAELRWAREEISEDTFALDTGENILAQDAAFTALTPRFTLNYQATDNNLIFATVARGTKPGGFNGADADALGFGSFDEESLWTFELGSKNILADRQFVLNAAAFYTTLSGYQLTENLAALGSTSAQGSATANLGDVEIYGIELETSFSPRAIPGLTIGATYAYTSAEFTAGTESTQALVFGDGSLAGQTIPRQAPHQVSFYSDYFTEISSDWDALFAVNGNYMSSRFAQVQNLAETGDSFEVDARMTFTYQDTYSVIFYGKNLTNERAPLGVLRFIDPHGTNSFPLAPTAFNLAAAGQSRGFQYNNRLGARWGVILRAKF